jgi:hypothetical protein
LIVYYLDASSPDDLYRARALLSGLDPTSVTVVSNRPSPQPFAGRWQVVADDDRAVAHALTSAAPTVLVADAPAGRSLPLVAAIGVPTAVVARPGGGQDGDEGSLYSAADLILAPWGAGFDCWPAAWRARTQYVGLLAAALDQQPGRRSTAPDDSASTWRCVALAHRSSGPTPRERREIFAATAGWAWFYALEDELATTAPVWHHLARAEVVVCLPHVASLAAVAAARLPAVVVRPGRPNASERALVSMVEAAGAAVVADSWARVDAWPSLLTRARELGGRRWSSFLVDDPGTHAARALLAVAAGAQTPVLQPGTLAVSG